MKLSSFKIARAAYAFVVSHISIFVRILWLPLLLVFAWAALLGPQIVSLACALGKATTDGARALLVLDLVFGLLLFVGGIALLACIMCGGLWRFILRGASFPVPFYLSFGDDERRLLRVLSLKLLLLLALGFGTAVVAGFVVVAVAHFSKGFSPAAGVTAFLFTFFVVGWAETRLSLAGPASIKEQRVALAESWRSTKGLVANLRQVSALVFTPVVVIAVMLFVLLLSALQSWLLANAVPLNVTPADLADACARLFNGLGFLPFLLLFVLYILMLFVWSLFIAARAFEYEAIQPPTGMGSP